MGIGGCVMDHLVSIAAPTSACLSTGRGRTWDRGRRREPTRKVIHIPFCLGVSTWTPVLPREVTGSPGSPRFHPWGRRCCIPRPPMRSGWRRGPTTNRFTWKGDWRFMADSRALNRCVKTGTLPRIPLFWTPRGQTNGSSRRFDRKGSRLTGLRFVGETHGEVEESISRMCPPRRFPTARSQTTRPTPRAADCAVWPPRRP